MNIRKLKDLSKDELIELIKQEREACGQHKPISEAMGQPTYGFYDPGMTLRDYFAAKAMQGILSKPNVAYDPKDLAKVAVEYADAMLGAREKQE